MHETYIDYLQYSRLMSEQELDPEFFTDVPPVRFYRRGYQDPLGTRLYFGNPNSKKALVVLSGRALNNRRVARRDDKSTIEDALSNGAKITRLDIAITDYSSRDMIEPRDIEKMYSDNEIAGTLAKYGCKTVSRVDIGQPPETETVYIGDIKRRGKNGIFRAYDYQLAHGIIGHAITRLELEERGSNAHNSAKRYVSGYELKSILESRLQFDNPKMKAILDTEAIDMTRGKTLDFHDEKEKEDQRWIWLMKQVAPALRDAVKKDQKSGKGNRRLLLFLESAGIV